MRGALESRSRFAFPVSSVVIAAIAVFAFRMEMHAARWGFIERVMEDFSFSWTPFLQHPWANLPKMLSHMFMHANTEHITGNLIFFALFAPAIERCTGHLLFIVFYLLWGVAAACAQGFFQPFSGGMIGASGAISGAAGAYFVLYPLRTPPSLLMRPFGKFASNIPAFFWIGLWFLGQLKGGFRALAPDLFPVEHVARWAHIGGFAAGALTMAPFVWRGGKNDSD